MSILIRKLGNRRGEFRTGLRRWELLLPTDSKARCGNSAISPWSIKNNYSSITSLCIVIRLRIIMGGNAITTMQTIHWTFYVIFPMYRSQHDLIATHRRKQFGIQRPRKIQLDQRRHNSFFLSRVAYPSRGRRGEMIRWRVTLSDVADVRTANRRRITNTWIARPGIHDIESQHIREYLCTLLRVTLFLSLSTSFREYRIIRDTE